LHEAGVGGVKLYSRAGNRSVLRIVNDAMDLAEDGGVSNFPREND
jgi:hypothetical protein